MNTRKGLKLTIIFTVVVLGSGLAGLLLSAEQKTENTKEERKMYRKLTTAERRVIVHKGTEAPFSGEYNNHFEKAYIHAEDAVRNFSSQKRNSNRIAAGRASTNRFPEQSNGLLTPMECEQKLPVRIAGDILDMFSLARD
jgi:hypothetical protein